MFSVTITRRTGWSHQEIFINQFETDDQEEIRKEIAKTLEQEHLVIHVSVWNKKNLPK